MANEDIKQNDIQRKLEKITQKIVKEFQPEKIILFGSYAWGESGPDSDVDLLVIKETSRPRLELERELRSIIFPAGVPLDVLVYSPSTLEDKIKKDRNLFLEDIVKNGTVLYEHQ